MNDDDPGTSGYAYRQAATAYQHALETFGSMGSGAYWGEGDRWYALGAERQAAAADVAAAAAYRAAAAWGTAIDTELDQAAEPEHTKLAEAAAAAKRATES